MYIHQEIMLAVLPIWKKYQSDGFEPADLIAEMNHAAWELSGFNAIGFNNMLNELTKQAELKQGDLK